MDGRKLVELKQERAVITNSIRDVMNEFDGKVMDGTKKDEMAKLEARFDELNDIINKEEKQLGRERLIGEAANDNVKTKVVDKADEVRAAFRDYLVTGNRQTLDVYNALQQTTPTQGGYLVPPEKFVNELIKELDNLVFIRQKARVLPPLQGAQSLGYPTRTARMTSAVWGTEISAPTPDTTLAFGKKEFKPNPATAEILVSKTLIRNAPDVEAIVRSEIASVFAALMEQAYMTGNGTDQPLGLFTASADGIPTSRDVSDGNTVTAITFDGLIAAKYFVKQQYQPNAEWLFSRTAIKNLATLKDAVDGRYIWQPSAALGVPDILLGKPVNMSEYVPATFTTGLYVGLYGDLKNYWICDSVMMEMQVLTELYARTNQVDYIARIETDGQPVVAEAFARVKLG